MKSIVCLSLILSWLTNFASAAITVNFDDLSGYSNTTADGSYFNGYSLGATSGSWQTQGLSFNTEEFGPGWSYSNVNNTTKAGYTNEFASATGTGSGGSGNYVIAYGSGAYFNLPSGQRIESLLISSTTYAHLSMLNGDSFAKKFGGPSGNDPDFLKVTFTGYSSLSATGASTGSAEFYLADFRNANNTLDYIVTDWQSVGLTGLGDARSVGLTFTGSDNHPTFGLNTPAYAAFDNFSLSAVPEPSGLMLLSCASVLLTLRRAQRQRTSPVESLGGGDASLAG